GQEVREEILVLRKDFILLLILCKVMASRTFLQAGNYLYKVANRGISPKTALKQWSCCHKTQSRSISISHVLKKDDNAEGSTMTIPEPPSLVPADALNSPSIVDATEVLDKVGVTLNAAGEPCMASYGLGGMWPSGWVQHALEFLHANVGMPWWLAILAGTVAVRLALFPLVVKAQINAAHFSEHMPQFQRLQQNFNEAKAYGNKLEAARLMHELNDFMKKKDINPFRALKLPLVQAPIFMSIFFALRGMASAPVDSLRVGGLAWFQDLTVPDPTYVLPVLTCATLAVVMKVGVDTGSNAMANNPLASYFFKAIPVILFPFIMNFPTNLAWYWFCANSVSLLQVSFLKIPAVRQKLGIPVKREWTPEDLPGTKKGFVEGFKDSWANMKAVKVVEERKRADELQFRRAGMGPVPKTYKYDPTKSPPTAQNILAKGSETKS
ncbi:hypothetical protein QYM36_004020, partial [Artemia franciscana]